MKLKQYTIKEVLDDMSNELKISGLSENECEERARNIFQACVGKIPHWRDIMYMISPSEINKGIECAIERPRAATQVLAVYVQGISTTTNELFERLIEDLGFTPQQADEWIGNRRREGKLY